MGFTISADILDALGLAYSIIGLAFIIPILFVWKQYFRFHIHMQFLYLFYIAYAPTLNIFSQYAQVSWGIINQNFYNFCKNGDLVCTLGFQASFTTCVVGVIFLVFLITMCVACKKQQAKFQPVYRFFKGLIVWTYIPLVYYSLYFLIKSIKGQVSYLTESIVIISICAIFPIFQLIAYKCIQKQEQLIWPKWLQFIFYMEILSVASLVAVNQAVTNAIPRYFIYGVIVINMLFYTIKNRFSYKVFGRILYILGQCCLITLFSIFIFKTSYLNDYHLDLILVSVVLFFDILFYLAEICHTCKHGMPKDTDSQRINPQESQAGRGLKNRNSYDVELQDNQFHDPKERYRDSSYNQLDVSKSTANLRNKSTNLKSSKVGQAGQGRRKR